MLRKEKEEEEKKVENEEKDKEVVPLEGEEDSPRNPFLSDNAPSENNLRSPAKRTASETLDTIDTLSKKRHRSRKSHRSDGESDIGEDDSGSHPLQQAQSP